MGKFLGWEPHHFSAIHKKQALHLAAQLPDDPEEARMVLAALQALMDAYIDRLPTIADAVSNILPFAG